MKKITLAAAALAMSGSVAFAAGPSVVVVEPPVYVPAAQPYVYNWTGGYVGVGLTYGQATHASNVGLGAFPDSSGPGLGVLLGYNWQNGNMVFGGEAAAVFSRMNGAGACGPGGAFACTSRINNFGALRARLGVAMDNTLLFVTAGWAHDGQSFTATPGFSGSANFRGPVVGVGVEHGFSPEWSVRGDLEHYRYRAQNIGGGVVVTPRTNLARLSIVRRF